MAVAAQVAPSSTTEIIGQSKEAEGPTRRLNSERGSTHDGDHFGQSGGIVGDRAAVAAVTLFLKGARVQRPRDNTALRVLAA